MLGHRSTSRYVLLALLIAVWGQTAPLAIAKPNWRNFVPFGRRVEADPNKAYGLTEQNGPWMILVSSFAGEGAERQAQELVFELRRRYNFEAYVYHKTYDFSEPVIGKGVDRYNNPKRMKHRIDAEVTEFAVLVGNYAAIDHPRIEKDLDRLKHLAPDALDLQKRETSTQRFIGLRHLHRAVHPDPSKRELGPMGNAFVTKNPLLPAEFFNPSGVDAFVLKLNRNVEHSLLQNPKKYTVRVATFRGDATFDTMASEEPIRKGNQPTKLELAAENAHRLVVALRKQGVPAYEYHDRYESIVTVGGFDSVGTPRPDGKTEINPEIHAVMKQFGAEMTKLANGTQGMQPKRLAGIPFDLKPWPVEVPRRSVAADYAQRTR